MIQYIRRLALCCALLASLSLAACGGNQPVADSGMAVMQTGPVVSEPDPEAAIDAGCRRATRQNSTVFPMPPRRI